MTIENEKEPGESGVSIYNELKRLESERARVIGESLVQDEIILWETAAKQKPLVIERIMVAPEHSRNPISYTPKK